MSDKIIYLVTSGDYSDYHVCAVFDSKDIAEQYLEQYNNLSANSYLSKAKIEEYPLNAAVTPEGFIYDIIMWRDGDIQGCYFCSDPQQSANDGRVTEMGRFQIRVRGKTTKHAIKIANEKRTFLIANNQYRHKP